MPTEGAERRDVEMAGTPRLIPRRYRYPNAPSTARRRLILADEGAIVARTADRPAYLRSSMTWQQPERPPGCPETLWLDSDAAVEKLPP